MRTVPPEHRTAAIAAGVLVLSMLLPWYEKSYFDKSGAKSANLSAFGVFTFVEAAVLLVAAGVLYLIWARARRKAFHLPGGRTDFRYHGRNSEKASTPAAMAAVRCSGGTVRMRLARLGTGS